MTKGAGSRTKALMRFETILSPAEQPPVRTRGELAQFLLGDEKLSNVVDRPASPAAGGAACMPSSEPSRRRSTRIPEHPLLAMIPMLAEPEPVEPKIYAF